MKNKFRNFLILILCITLLPISAFAEGDGGGDDNAESGDGSAHGKIEGKGSYKYGEWMYKVSLYVGLSDIATTSTSFYYGYKAVGEPVFIKPTNFSLPGGVTFGKYNKVEYLRGKELGFAYANSVKIVDDNPPAIPITNGGRLSAVKSYFGDSGTLIRLINNIAQHQGTTRKGLVKNIEFTIDRKKGRQNPDDILPIRGADGKYKNKVPWVIIYEPVAIAYLKDGNTKLAFTATEYALAQENGLFNFFHSGEDAQDIASMTHCNLPNSVVLERGWFDYAAYSPTDNNRKWSNARIINGGGWGMRIMYPYGNNMSESITPTTPPVEDKNNDNTLSVGDYRVDTDVITSFRVSTDKRITPDNEATVTFKVGGRTISRTDIVLPDGGSQLVWAKWHTPLEPCTVNITAQISGSRNAKFRNGGRSKTKTADIINLDENVPPDPVAKDPKTGKPIQAPAGYIVPNIPWKREKTTATWGDWSAYWEADWVWHEKWKRVVCGYYTDKSGKKRKEYEWEDQGKYVDEGDWEYFWNSYRATLSADYDIKPDEKVPTAKQFYSDWEMKSGYGLNIEVELDVSTDAPDSAIAIQGNVINYFPEFDYDKYCRLSERMEDGKFELKKNKYSTFKQRVHFTPLWFPDDEKYTTYSEVVDVWTPAGMLTLGLDDFINIKGNVFDDWTVVPVEVD